MRATDQAGATSCPFTAAGYAPAMTSGGTHIGGGAHADAPGTAAAVEQRQLGHSGGKLRTIDCIAQSLAVGPIFSAAVIGFILADLSGGVGPFVIILTTVGILGLGYLISELAKRFSGTGTVYEYVAHTLGKKPAVFSAGAYHLAAISLYTGIPIIGSIFIKSFLATHMNYDPPWWLAALAVLVFTIGVNLIGVQVSVRTQLLIIIASLVPFLILAVAIILEGGTTGNTASVFNPDSIAEGGSVFKGLLFAILMFVGFELAAALGEETERPQRSIPIAIIATILICGAFYALTQYVGTVGSGGLDALPFDFAVLGETYVDRWLSVLIELAIILDILAVGIGFTAATSRGLFTLARDGLLPSRLAAVNRKDVPSAATYAVGALGLAVIIIGLLVYGTAVPTDASGAIIGPPDVFNEFTVTSTIGAFVICIVYVLVALGGITYFAFRDNVPGAVLAGVVGLITAGAGVAAQFIDGTAPVGDALWGRHLGLVLLAVVLVWLIANLVARPARVAAAGDRALRYDLGQRV